ncbi:TIGR02757 family protein [Halocola ammonii]
MKRAELREFLEKKVDEYNTPRLIGYDPISIPHRFSKKEDIEISAFLAATIAWGQRKTIIRNANFLMERMEEQPHQFISQFELPDLERFSGFVHRTFNEVDLRHFLISLQNIYRQHGGLESAFYGFDGVSQLSGREAILRFRELFFQVSHEKRTEKHVSDPARGSSAKRLNMFLRWMVRKDSRGVDFGIWQSPSMSGLSIPLDVHTGRVSRKLKLLKRKQNDWKAVAELDEALRKLDPEDPVKYDFALFGLGAFEKF